jgi:hypothetical protein
MSVLQSSSILYQEIIVFPYFRNFAILPWSMSWQRETETAVWEELKLKQNVSLDISSLQIEKDCRHILCCFLVTKVWLQQSTPQILKFWDF